MRSSSRCGLSLLLAGLVCGLLNGCELSSTGAPTAEAGVAFSGKVMGGQQVIVGAHVYLFAANTTGNGGPGIAASSGNTSVSLLTSSGPGTTQDTSGGPTNGDYYVTTDSKGLFSITSDYSCASGQQVYLYALGGNPGSGTNSAAGLLEVLGNCLGGTSAFASSDPNIVINEVTTIAAAYAFAGFATDATHVSSSGAALAKTGIANAFANAGSLANIVTGNALATTPAGNGTVPQTEIYTLANTLAACVNSTGPGSSACATLFADAKSGGSSGTAATDTATAAINMAHNPGANIAALYALSIATPPFAPALGAQPNDLTLVVSYTGGGLSGTGGIAIDASGDVWIGNTVLSGTGNSISEFGPTGVALSPSTGYTGGGLTAPQAIAIDASGNVWVASGSKTVSADNVISKFNASGSPLSGSSGYTAGGLSDPFSIAIDTSGNVWVSNHVAATISELNSSGTPVSGSPFSGGGLASPHFMAIDNSGNIWTTNNDNNSVSKFNSSGVAISGSSGYSGGGLDEPYGIAIDASGNVWVTNFFFNTLSELNSTGSPISSSSGYSGGGLSSPYGIAIDGSGYVWVANPGNNSISEFNSSGTAISGSSGFSSGSLTSPVDLAIDGSGNIWVTSQGGTAVGEYIGAATPVVTPILGGSANTGSAGVIYVVQQPATGNGTILEFSATASGSVSPTATITPGLPLEQVNTDQSGNIYIATTQGISEYAAGATGTPTSLRTIPVTATTGIYQIDGMAVSPTGEILIGQDGGDVDEWSATQSGSVAPERRIPGYSQTGGSLSPVVVANQVAIDGSDNIYIAPLGITTVVPPAVVIYGPSANGTVAPSRSVNGTGLVSGVTVDSTGNIYTASATCTFVVGPPPSQTCNGTISEYAATAGATDAPIRTISGALTQLSNLSGIKVDAAGNIYVVSTTLNFGTVTNPTVLKFAATATGNVAPTSSFTSTAWTSPDSNPSIALH